jgi:hypothetical protein
VCHGRHAGPDRRPPLDSGAPPNHHPFQRTPHAQSRLAGQPNIPTIHLRYPSSSAGSSVGLPAVSADLAVAPRERADVAHPNHGRDEVAREGAPVARVLRRDAVHGAGTEELLVGVEQPELRHQVAEVAVVERHGALRVQGRQVAVAPLQRADLPPPRREPGVDVAVVVQARPEARAPRRPDRVRAGQRHEVARVQALGPERGQQGRRARRRRREVAVRRALARRARVAPAQRHRPARPAQLHCYTLHNVTSVEEEK